MISDPFEGPTELKLRRVSTMTDSRPPRAQIPESMQAVVCHGPGDYELEEVAVPRPGPGEVLVKVEAVGICASDLKCYHGAAKFWGDENRPAYAETEVIPGHEFVGTVIELDEAAAGHWNIAVDDRVVSEQIVPCWKCRYCRRRSLLDVRTARYLRLQAPHPRGHGGIHDLFPGRSGAQGLS